MDKLTIESDYMSEEELQAIFKGVDEVAPRAGGSSNSIVPDSIHQSQSRYPDSRIKLPAADLGAILFVLAIPATYVIKKLSDPILDELGKALFVGLKKWTKKLTHKQESRKAYFVIRIDIKQYLLDTEQLDKIGEPQEIAEVLVACMSHSEQSKRGSRKSLCVFEVTLDGNGATVQSFDPFPS